MKMSNNPAKYEVLIKQYLRSILDISEAAKQARTLLTWQPVRQLHCSFTHRGTHKYAKESYSLY